jgi:ribosomal-protein-alanine N-acetyltransferase
LRDLDDIDGIELECFTDESFSKELLKCFLTSPDFVTLIAVLDGEPAGFITGSIFHSKGKLAGHIFTLDVKRKFRRRGVGSTLLDALECVLAEKGVEVCYLEVRLDNVAAKRLYLKRGYKLLEVLEDYYGFGEPAVRLQKRLKDREAEL